MQSFPPWQVKSGTVDPTTYQLTEKVAICKQRPAFYKPTSRFFLFADKVDRVESARSGQGRGGAVGGAISLLGGD